MSKLLISVITTLAVATLARGQISKGPSNTTQKIGSTFTLYCYMTYTNSDTRSWTLIPHNHQDNSIKISKDGNIQTEPSRYQLSNTSNTYHLTIRNASYNDDGTFTCQHDKNEETARVKLYDEPKSMSLEWVGVTNAPGAVKAGSSYKLECETINSHPPAVHRYFMNGIELNTTNNIEYVFENSTNSASGYGNTTTILKFTPSKEDVDEMKRIMCVADLYDKKNVTAASFRINSGHKMSTFGILSTILIISTSLLCF